MSDPYDTLPQPEPGDTGTGRVAYRHLPRKASLHGEGSRAASENARRDPGPDLLFCGGFHSNMDGGKASFLHARCAEAGRGFTRFDYRGHGLSDGRFRDGTIGDWAADARLILDRVCLGPQIVVGSSMGAWMALMLARDRPNRVAGLILIAPAPDFPRRLMLPQMPPEARGALNRDGVWHRPSEFEEDDYPITRRLVEESAAHELLDGPPVEIHGPVHILHGAEDEVVPLDHARRVADWIAADGVTLEVVDGGGHRLSDPEDLDRLWRAVSGMRAG
jgi:pimeloyl-ACP methyl ester carboxylesterase